MPYRALALDLDGTLLNETGNLEPHLIPLLHAASEQGIGVHLVSGRMHPAIVPFWEQIGLRSPIISYNGGKIQTPGHDPLYEARLAPDLAQEIIDYCRGSALHVNAYFEDKLYVFHANQTAEWYAAHFRIPLHILGDHDPWPGEAPAKLLVIVPNPEEVQGVYDDLNTRFNDRARLTTSSRMFVELLPPGVSKASGIERVAALEGTRLEDWVAVGDGMNDLEMLKECGIGLAVTNGDPALLSLVTQTAPPLYAGGMEYILQKVFALTLPASR